MSSIFKEIEEHSYYQLDDISRRFSQPFKKYIKNFDVDKTYVVREKVKLLIDKCKSVNQLKDLTNEFDQMTRYERSLEELTESSPVTIPEVMEEVSVNHFERRIEDKLNKILTS